MSTIKSSAENLTLNADGANNDVIIQSNGSTKVTVDGATGNVGVGTTSISIPSGTALEVYDATVPRIKLANSTTGNASGDGFDMHIDGSTKDVKLFQRESANIILATNGAERVRVQSGGGISFNGDTAAANALDDYEEGAWTPAYAPVSGAAFTSVTYVGAVPGRYTKIGNLVTVFCYIGTDGINKGSATAGALVKITGLPFTSENVGAGNFVVGCGGTKWAGEVPSMVEIRSQEAFLRLYFRASITADESDITVADLNTGGGGQNYVRMQISYRV